jgi:RNA polymerase sigma factor (sigma-70 family)
MADEHLPRGTPDDIHAWIRAAVSKYEQPLTSYALRMTGDIERARDAVQETFLRLCREDRSKIEAHLAEWLYSVCRSRALDSQRKEKRMSAYSATQAGAPEATAPAPHESVEQKESTGIMLETLANLPPNQQEVIRLKFQHGMSYREISRITSLSVTNVGFLIHTGLKTLRQRLVGIQN